MGKKCRVLDRCHYFLSWFYESCVCLLWGEVELWMTF